MHLLIEAFRNGGIKTVRQGDHSPYITDLFLLREFRYRFDPTWRPETFSEESLKEYIHFASPWADATEWDLRPWSVTNFPKPPRSAFVFPQFKNLEQRKSDPSYQNYQFTCSKIRALFKAFPDILRAPVVWRRCMGINHQHSSIAKAVKRALKGKRQWREIPQEHIEFEIRKMDGQFDIQFVSGRRRFVSGGRKLEFAPPPQGLQIQGGRDRWRANIVGVSGDQVYIRLKAWD